LTQTNEKIKTENSISENKSQESQVMSKQWITRWPSKTEELGGKWNRREKREKFEES
jgi:hypothetical protein